MKARFSTAAEREPVEEVWLTAEELANICSGLGYELAFVDGLPFIDVPGQRRTFRGTLHQGDRFAGWRGPVLLRACDDEMRLALGLATLVPVPVREEEPACVEGYGTIGEKANEPPE